MGQSRSACFLFIRFLNPVTVHYKSERIEKTNISARAKVTHLGKFGLTPIKKYFFSRVNGILNDINGVAVTDGSNPNGSDRSTSSS